MTEPTSTTCTQLSDVMGISHDSVNRFLSRESYQPKDLFNESMALIDPWDVTLSVDDSVLDKPYSQHMALVDYFRDMFHEVLDWDLSPRFVMGDSWYSCAENLNMVKKHQIGFVFGVERNRRISTEKGSCQRMQINDFFSNAYRWQRALYTQVLRASVTDFSKDR